MPAVVVDAEKIATSVPISVEKRNSVLVAASGIEIFFFWGLRVTRFLFEHGLTFVSHRILLLVMLVRTFGVKRS